MLHENKNSVTGVELNVLLAALGKHLHTMGKLRKNECIVIEGDHYFKQYLGSRYADIFCVNGGQQRIEVQLKHEKDKKTLRERTIALLPLETIFLLYDLCDSSKFKQELRRQMQKQHR